MSWIWSKLSKTFSNAQALDSCHFCQLNVKSLQKFKSIQKCEISRNFRKYDWEPGKLDWRNKLAQCAKLRWDGSSLIIKVKALNLFVLPNIYFLWATTTFRHKRRFTFTRKRILLHFWTNQFCRFKSNWPIRLFSREMGYISIIGW